jgi:hypothetical protein
VLVKPEEEKELKALMCPYCGAPLRAIYEPCKYCGLGYNEAAKLMKKGKNQYE